MRHNRSIGEGNCRAEFSPKKIPQLEQQIKILNTDLADKIDTKGDAFRMTIGGTACRNQRKSQSADDTLAESLRQVQAKGTALADDFREKFGVKNIDVYFPLATKNFGSRNAIVYFESEEDAIKFARWLHKNYADEFQSLIYSCNIRDTVRGKLGVVGKLK